MLIPLIVVIAKIAASMKVGVATNSKQQKESSMLTMFMWCMGGGLVLRMISAVLLVAFIRISTQGGKTTAPTAEQEWTVNDMRLIDAGELVRNIDELSKDAGFYRASYEWFSRRIKDAPTIDAVLVERIEQVKNEILYRMDEFITEYRFYSESTVDHFGGKADAMDVARRLVNAALTDLCSYGERKDGEG